MSYSVTIIIPVYNISNYIERCLDSVIRQTYKNIECIIVDDGSLDDSLGICKKKISEYNGPIKFYILQHNCNKGLSAARNTGTESATGDYIYYLDGDDEISSDCIETLMFSVFADDNMEMVQGDYCRCITTSKQRKSKDISFTYLFSNNDAHLHFFKYKTIYISAWNKLLKRSFINKFNLRFRDNLIFEDYLWSFYLVKYLQYVCVVNKVTYKYLDRPGSIVKGTNIDIKGRDFAIIYNELLMNLTPKYERSELSFYVEGFCHQYVKYKARNTDFNRILKEYQKLAKNHKCWIVYMKLSFTFLVSRSKYGLTILKIMRTFRPSLKK